MKAKSQRSKMRRLWKPRDPRRVAWLEVAVAEWCALLQRPLPPALWQVLVAFSAFCRGLLHTPLDEEPPREEAHARAVEVPLPIAHRRATAPADFTLTVMERIRTGDTVPPMKTSRRRAAHASTMRPALPSREGMRSALGVVVLATLMLAISAYVLMVFDPSDLLAFLGMLASANTAFSVMGGLPLFAIKPEVIGIAFAVSGGFAITRLAHQSLSQAH